MTGHPSRISISLHEGTIEIEGSETFVEAQVTRFEKLITQFLSASPDEATGKSKRQRRSPKRKDEVAAEIDEEDDGAEGGDADALEEFEEVFTVKDDEVQIHQPIPGKTEADKMAAVAKLVTLALTLNGTEEIPSATIRDVCKDQGCLNSANFAKTMKRQKGAFRFIGSGRKMKLKLTGPGKRAAREFAQSLIKSPEK